MFSGKVAVITGAAKGIGLAVARTLGRGGADLVLGDLDFAELEAAARKISAEFGVKLVPLKVDVAEPDSVKSLIQTAEADFGRLDFLVNNAGICPFTPLEEISLAEWDRVLDINLKSVFVSCQAAVPLFRAQGGGAIVNIASISGKTGGVTVGPPYTASKAGVIGLTKSFACYLAQFGARANAVAPGPVNTPMAQNSPPEIQAKLAGAPLGGLSEPEDLAAAVCFLLSDQARRITGATLDVNGGLLMD